MDLMAKAQREKDEAEDDASPAPQGWPSRAMIVLRHALLVPLERMIEQLHRLRQRLVAADGQDVEADRPAPVKRAPRQFGPLRIVLLAVAMLMLGLVGGAVFSFRLFAQKIESQIDVIGNQADEVFAYDKETRHAERLLEKTKAELKDVRQELADTQAELKNSRLALARGDGRGVLSGAQPRSPDSPVGQADIATTPRYVPHLTPMRPASGTCRLGYATSASDLSKCLDQGGQ